MNNCYRVIFCGDVAHGYEVGEVKEKITSMLKEDAETIDKLFSGQTLIIKRDPDLTKCEKVRKMFLAVGAVCYIEDPETQISIDLDVITENSSQQKAASDSKPSGKRSIKLGDVKGKIASVKSVLAGTKDKVQQTLVKASTSIKADMQAGGMKMLFKNKYFLAILAIVVAVLLVIIVCVTYQGKAMPLSEKNYNQLFDHVEFVEKAFIDVELENMKKNPADFWEYLLIEPIEKMGYEFEATINEISTQFLNDDFNPTEKRRAVTILKLVTPEREKLFESGVISGSLKKNLDKSSNKMGI